MATICSMNAATFILGPIFAIAVASCGSGGSEYGVGGPPSEEIKVFTQDETVKAGETVTLGAGATHSSLSPIGYSWSQQRGPLVEIETYEWYYRKDNGELSEPYTGAKFVAPPVKVSTYLEFRVTAADHHGNQGTTVATILVQPKPTYSLCEQPPLLATIYVWAGHGCTTDSDDFPEASLVATVYRQQEIESNDSSELANSISFSEPVAETRIGANVVGSLNGDSLDNEDYFIFTPPVSGSYYFFLCDDATICDSGSKTDAVYFSLTDQNLNELGATQAGSPQIQEISAELDAGLPYYLDVRRSVSHTGAYQYNVTIAN